jgi:phage recombination protein Bet
MTDNALAPTDDMFSDARIDMIRNMVAKDAPADVFAAMIDIARRRNLDPLAKQISVIRFGSSWQMIVTIDGYRAIAEQTGKYAGSDAPIFTYGEPPAYTSSKKMIPESATVTVYKIVSGTRCPFTATVFWDEYNGGRNNWVSMPRTMLAKVAESHALRKAFPAVLSGTYTQEEMDQAGPVETTGRIVDVQTSEIQQRSPQAPQQPRNATQLADTTPDPPKPAHSAGMRKIHAVGNQHGFSHEELRMLCDREEYAANKQRITSMNDAPEALLHYVADLITKNPENQRKWLDLHTKQAQAELMPDVHILPNPDRHTG